jgi:cytidylate kinase
MAIITISREMGSAGIPISHTAAEKLGYTLVDGDELRKVAHSYGLSPDALDKADETPPAFVEPIDCQTEANYHRIQLIILEYALKGNVIIYGRGGQDLLKNIDSVLKVRIIAPFEDRVERWSEREWLDPEMARVLVRKSDQQRAGFIKYYFARDWNDPINYDLVINTQHLSEETAVKLICDAIKDPNLVRCKDNSKKNLKDMIVRKKIETDLFSRGVITGLHQYHVHIEVQDGKVTLDGHVHNQQELQDVLDATSQTEGSLLVANNLEIRHYQSHIREH